MISQKNRIPRWSSNSLRNFSKQQKKKYFIVDINYNAGSKYTRFKKLLWITIKSFYFILLEVNNLIGLMHNYREYLNTLKINCMGAGEVAVEVRYLPCKH